MPQSIARYTPEEYYRLEKDAEYRSEFYEGEIFAMAGASFTHVEICSNLIFELRRRMPNGPCRPLESNLRLLIKATGLRTYPDVSVYCGPFERDDQDPSGQTAINPTVLFEVLSKSTEGYDRGIKAENYRQIESLRALVIVSQGTPHVEIYERQADGSWLFREVSGLEASLAIGPISVNLPLAEVYARVNFADAE